jgi:hypothetical protein
MARLPVAIPTQRRLNATEGFSLVNERLSRMLGQHGRAWSDEELLAAYQELRERTGLHPADLMQCMEARP